MRFTKSKAKTQTILSQVFKEHVSELYWLAFVITGDRNQSVQAFTNALDVDEASPTCWGFMLSWARKLIIAAALGTIASQLHESRLRTQATATDWDIPDDLCSAAPKFQSLTRLDLEQVLLAIDVFPRCAMLLTLFEGLPAADASTLLNADRKLVRLGQVQGLIELARNVASGYHPTIASHQAGLTREAW